MVLQRKKSSTSGTASAANGDLTVECLRSELELQFEHFSKKFVSEDLIPTMKQLIEELLTQHVGTSTFGSEDVDATHKRDFYGGGRSRKSHHRRKSVGASHDSSQGRLLNQSTTDLSMTRWLRRKGTHLPTDDNSVPQHHQPKKRTHRISESHSTFSISQSINSLHSSSTHMSDLKNLDPLVEIPEESWHRPRHLERVRPSGVDNRTLAQDRSTTARQLTFNEESIDLISSRSKMSLLIKAQSQNDDDDDEDTSASEEYENESQFSRFVRSKSFDYLFCFILALSAVTLGLQTDYCARNWSDRIPNGFLIANRIFCFLFVLEIVLRLHTNGPRLFFAGFAWQYNVFDLLVVCLQLFDEIISPLIREDSAKYPVTVSLMRLLRYFRLLRIMRLSRAMNFLVSVRVLVVSIIASLQSLGWVLVLLAMQTFVASIPLTQLATDYKLAKRQHGIDEELEKYYGSVTKTMLALYEILTDGMHWDEMMRPLVQHTSPWLILFFVAYSAFSIFAMMNVVTGIFVDSALVAAEESRKNNLLKNLKSAFMEGVSQGSITLEMFELQMTTNPNMVYFLKAIDLVPSDAAQLFVLLDEDGSGEIDTEELLSGLTRLQGNAKAMDLAVLMHQFSKHVEIWEDHFRQLEGDLNRIAHVQKRNSESQVPNSSAKNARVVTNVAVTTLSE